MRVRLTVTPVAKVPSAPFRVGGQGKPVRNRRGPATVTGDATRTSARAPEPLGRRRRAGKARDGRPGSQETCPDRKAHIALVERGGFMLHRLAGLALAVLALLVTAAPALAGPTVTVRVEGQSATLLAPTTVTLGDTPVTLADGTTCPSNSAAAALDAGTGGNWDRAAFVSTILGESHTFTANDSWAEWVDNKYGNGLCTDLLGPGGELLMLVDTSDASFNPTVFPLVLSSVPASATAGTPFVVAVTQFSTSGTPGTSTPGPARGGTVTAGGASATTGADGRATLTLATPGTVSVRATRGSSRSVAVPLTIAAPGQAAAAPGAAGQGVAGVAVDRTAPRARLLSPRSGHVYRFAKFSPRLIRVAVAESGSGVRSVKVRLTRRVGNRCFSFSGRRERFIGAKCGRGFFFTVSDRADFTYLLPERLGRGHYVLDVEAIDRAFNRDSVGDRGRNRSVFDVR